MHSVTRTRIMASRRRVLLILSVAGLIAATVGVTPVAAATTATLRSFSCTGGLGLAYTIRTVTGQLTAANVPTAIAVTAPGGVVDSSHPKRATLVGATGSSWLHSGYNNWDITGPNPSGDLFNLHLPPVLPGGGGFFDADLEISFAGGANGGWQIPLFDCKVTGGPLGLASGGGPRTFSCAGGLDVYANYTITGQLTSGNIPLAVKVTQVLGATLLSSHPRRATLTGPTSSSWLHAGYNDWDITGPNPNGDLFHLHVSPVLPRAGGFFDADLEIQFAGGANGNAQVPMFDCTVT
jgi:hypothetical protein